MYQNQQKRRYTLAVSRCSGEADEDLLGGGCCCSAMDDFRVLEAIGIHSIGFVTR